MSLSNRFIGNMRAQSKLSDYVSAGEITDVFTSGDEIITRNTPLKQNSQQKEKQSTPRNNTIFCQIQRNMPSPANIRVRAVKCFQDTSKATHEHSNKLSPQRNVKDICRTIPSIQEVMKDIVVYVEVRTGEDNRSAGVRKVIAALGARVNNKLLRSTTHVVFKDGLLSTYKRAKSMNIPIVSILWIEACKNELRICDPADFPISNLDRYENPELYEKLKRYKPIQRSSDGNKRVRAKKPVKPTPQSEGSKSSQSNITRYFKSQEISFLPCNNVETPTRITAGSVFESPATVLLNRISSNTYTPLANINNTKTNAKQKADTDKSKDPSHKSQNSHESSQSSVDNNITATTNCIAQMSICHLSQTTDNTTQAQKSPIRKRRTLCQVKTPTTTPNFQKEKHSDKQTSIVLMTEEVVLHEGNISKGFNMQSSVSRRTTFSYKPMDITGIETPTTGGVSRSQKQTSLRRRTLFTPQNIIESSNVDSNVTVTNSNTNRRTMFTPQNIIETPKFSSNVMTCNSTTTTCRTISEPKITMETPKVPKEEDINKTNNTPAGSANDETTYNYVVTPSSVSLGRRRTLFDISMDIISHQVSHLNSKSRLSIAPSNNNATESTPKTASNTNICVTAVTQNQCDNTEVVHGNTLSEPKENSTAESNETIESTTTNTTATAEKKKRKLFKPIESSPFTPPTLGLTASLASSRKSLSTPINTPKTAVKRRRTLLQKSVLNAEADETAVKVIPMVNSQTVVKKKLSSPPQTRRSTMDFETIRHIRSKANSNKLQDQKAQPVGKENNSKLSNAGGDVQFSSRRRLPFLAFTNMHKEQVEVINEAVQKLGRFKLDRCVCSATTHMVSLEPRRTMNLLRGLVRGLWILDYSWVVDSFKVGYWLPEESYEMKDFSRAVEICRAERQAFGSNYKCELFADLGAFFISPRCDNIPIRELKELIRLCGGKVEDHRQNAKFILSSCTKAFDDKIYVTPLWILDSITQMQLMRIQKYSAVTQLPTTQTVSNTRNMPTAIEFRDSQRLPNLERINCSISHHSRSPSKIVVDSRLSAIYSRTCTS